MKKFDRLTAVAAPLALANVDTDMIIPARFMKALTRVGLGRHLFQELRYTLDGTECSDFILNHIAGRRAQILIADRNFGCGSSREHAIWALTDFGIRCIIAPSFGEIFASNARKNGLLLIGLPNDVCETLRNEVVLGQFAPITIDLVGQCITLASGCAIAFDVDPDDRRTLMEGHDDIARTMRHEAAIKRFEDCI